MLIFLYGRDGYRLKQDLNILVSNYKAKDPDSLSFAVLDLAEKENLAKLEDSIKTVSFFGEKRLLILKNAFEKGEEISGLIESWNLSEDKERILVFVENLAQGELAKKDRRFFKILTSKPNIAKTFEPLTGKKLEDWIIKTVRELGGQIGADAVKKLIEYAGNDSWRLGQEISKLADYRQGLAPIAAEDVSRLVAPKIELNIFSTIDALGDRNKAQAFILLNKHLSVGEDPNYIFSMFVHQFRNLLKVKSLAENYHKPSEIAARANLHPFVAKKALEQAKKFELEELKEKFSTLAEADLKIKSGQKDLEDFLFQFALS